MKQRVIELTDFGVAENINKLSDAKKILPNKLTACILKRPRHNDIIKTLEKMGVKIKFKNKNTSKKVNNKIKQLSFF